MNKRRNGFMLLDVMAGLMILAVMATILVIAISGRSRAVQRISNHRTSIEAARKRC